MTFYELEHICKKRRIKKFFYIIFIILLIIIIVILSIFIFKMLNKEKVAKKEKVIKKQIVHYSKVPKTKRTENIILEPVIPDVTLENKTSKTVIKKEKIVKPAIKKENNISKPKTNNNSIIKIDTLPSYEECINLADKYLKEKKYDLALKWAKNANIQNRISPQSWIISAKALFYSGEKEKAKEILKIYLRYNKNKQIENLLKEFENEKNN